jgi:hypothetical protein
LAPSRWPPPARSTADEPPRTGELSRRWRISNYVKLVESGNERQRLFEAAQRPPRLYAA